MSLLPGIMFAEMLNLILFTITCNYFETIHYSVTLPFCNIIRIANIIEQIVPDSVEAIRAG